MFCVLYGDSLNFSILHSRRLRFSIVSEPQEEDDDCVDVGMAYVSIPDILHNGRNVFNEDIPS